MKATVIDADLRVDRDVQFCDGSSRPRTSPWIYTAKLELECDAEFWQALVSWMHGQGVSDDIGRKLPTAMRALPSAEKRLPPAPVDGELMDDE